MKMCGYDFTETSLRLYLLSRHGSVSQKTVNIPSVNHPQKLLGDLEEVLWLDRESLSFFPLDHECSWQGAWKVTVLWGESHEF